MKKLKAWQHKYEISDLVMNELYDILGLNISFDETNYVKHPAKSEAAVQVDARLKASKLGWRVWRNNSGVAVNPSGQPVRYGLCNDSKKMNQHIKSSDLIGVRPVLITKEMIGQTIGQFVALEVKPGDWSFTGTDREIAQLKFHQIVTDLGGYGKFINDKDQIDEIN